MFSVYRCKRKGKTRDLLQFDDVEQSNINYSMVINHHDIDFIIDISELDAYSE